MAFFTTSAAALRHQGTRIHKNAARLRRMQELENQDNKLLSEEKELAGLWGKGDTYDSSLFSDVHKNFKKFHNEVFATLSKELEGHHNLFYLDGACAATTSALISAERPLKSLYSANIFRGTCDALESQGINVHHGKGEDFLSASNSVVFRGCYLDSCGGKVEPLLDMIDQILRPSSLETFSSGFVGFTLTRASPCGTSLGDREAFLHRHIATLARASGFTTSRVSDDPPKQLGEWLKEDDGVITDWVMITRKDS